MLFWLLACSSPSECGDGYTLHDDGMCYADAVEDTDPVGDTDAEPPTVEDLLDALPACAPAATDGRLDVYAGCADGACAYTSYDDAVAALGEPSCSPFYYELGAYSGGSLNCEWSNGVELDFDDADQDGVIDPGSLAFGLGLNERFDGGTSTGLGIGANVACFVDELGPPSAVYFRDVDKEWFVTSASWEDHGVYATDSYDRFGSYVPDGKIESLTVYGSEVEL